MNSVVDSLQDFEKKVLLVLRDFDKVTSDIISEKAEISKDAVSKAISMLSEKKLVSFSMMTKELFKTSELGKKYTKTGLPEARFLRALPSSMSEIMKKAGLDSAEFNISLGISKRGNLAEINQGKITITKAGEGYLKKLEKQKELLNVLQEKKYLDAVNESIDDFIAPLEERKLIERSIEKIHQVTLTEAGKKILPDIKIEKQIDILTPEIIKTKEWKTTPFRKYSLNVPTPALHIGKKQPYMKFIDDVKQKMTSLGFEEMTGPYVELSFFNNEVLYMPQDHPAREIHDVFFIKGKNTGNMSKYKTLLEKVKKTHENGWETGSTGWGYKFDPARSAELLLRSQTTTVSARTMSGKNLKIPGKYFSYDRVFRVDEVDWKHLLEFNQFEGIVLDKDITFRELLGLLKMAAEELAGVKKFKYVPGYFPFTEPSVELHAYMEGKGWVELGGAGMFRPEVLEPMGIEVPVIAWGLGIDRLFMMKYNIKDIRQLFSSDLKWLREFKW